MSAIEHSPAPWHIDRYGTIWTGAGDTEALAVPHDGACIVIGDTIFDRTGSRYSPEAKANRNLIATAPELLKALEAEIEAKRKSYDKTDEAQTYFRENNAAALAVIAKARGATA